MSSTEPSGKTGGGPPPGAGILHLGREPFARRAGRRPWRRRALTALALALAFAAGLAVGRALDDGPRRAATQTSVRTLEPLPQRPASTP